MLFLVTLCRANHIPIYLMIGLYELYTHFKNKYIRIIPTQKHISALII